MALDYFYGQVGELFSFYRIPKALFLESRFQNLSTDAKTLYGILLDRMSLSAKNGWLDEQGRVFIIFTIEDVKRALCCADNKATKLLRELEEFGLIERKRRGLGRPSLVYVKNFSAESSKSIFQNRDFHDSGGFKSASQDPAKSRCNKTEENSTEKSETYPFYSEEDDGMSKHEQLEEYFSQSLELDILLRLCPDDEDTIYQIVDLLVDTCATNRKMLRIAGDDKPAEVVRSRFMKLNPPFTFLTRRTAQMDELNPTVREQEIYEEMELTPEMIKSIRTLCATCLRHFVEAKAFKIALVPSADRSMDTCTVCQTRRGHDYVVMHR